MQFDASLLVPTLRRSWDMAAAMPGTVLVGWLATAVAGVASDVAFDRLGDAASFVLIVYGILITFVQAWITREAFEQVGVAPALPIANSLSVYLQGLLIGLGVLLGLVLVILPGLYVFARWYLRARCWCVTAVGAGQRCSGVGICWRRTGQPRWAPG